MLRLFSLRLQIIRFIVISALLTKCDPTVLASSVCDLCCLLIKASICWRQWWWSWQLYLAAALVMTSRVLGLRGCGHWHCNCSVPSVSATVLVYWIWKPIMNLTF